VTARAFDDVDRKTVLAAIQASGGHLIPAAKALGVAHRTLSRTIIRLGLQAELDRIRSKVCPTCGKPR
jgi:transcriptional regulator with GAF, ATPase, and Fis domain